MIKEIDLDEYDYDLPEERIAQYPLEKRDGSKLLLYDRGRITRDVFSNIHKYIPSGSLLVFNNTSVIKARILFSKRTGAEIEVFCLEPLLPAEYETAFIAGAPVEWKCIVGNLKKWKNGTIHKSFVYNNNKCELVAEKIKPEGEAWRIRFSWNCNDLSFGNIIEKIGHVPLPPYLKREDEEEDKIRYQTVYSSVKGSVAAPTAGLHFTENIFRRLDEKGIRKVELTLHVGAGTFQPVKSEKITGHVMHSEQFFIDEVSIGQLIEFSGRIIPVGTTSVRTIESLYWLGVKALNNRITSDSDLCVGQWEPYDSKTTVSSKEALEALLKLIKERNKRFLHASTSIMIVPGYKFRLTDGMLTNFHQPRSTLLLLISAWVGSNWKSIYRYAFDNDFRFLSYGDSSLLLRH